MIVRRQDSMTRRMAYRESTCSICHYTTDAYPARPATIADDGNNFSPFLVIICEGLSSRKSDPFLPIIIHHQLKIPLFLTFCRHNGHPYQTLNHQFRTNEDNHRLDHVFPKQELLIRLVKEDLPMLSQIHLII